MQPVRALSCVCTVASRHAVGVAEGDPTPHEARLAWFVPSKFANLFATIRDLVGASAMLSRPLEEHLTNLANFQPQDMRARASNAARADGDGRPGGMLPA
jgi:hypothetical protein